MVRPRAAAARQPQEVNLAEMVVNLQRRLEDQEREMQNLREQLAQQNQEIPPPPTVPAQPAAPAVPAAQAGQPVIRQEPLYERFRRMKPPEFEGSTNPLEAEEWLTSLQIVLNFMNLTDQEKVFCASYVMKKDARYWWETVQMRRNVLEMTWNDFIQEFNDKFYNRMAMKAQQNEFNNIKQGTMFVTEAVRKFDQLARLCPHLVPTEDERVRRMLDMFRPEIAVVIDSGEKPPTTVAECVERALRAEYRLAQAKQERAKFFEEKKKEKSQSKQNQGNQLNNQGNRSNPIGNHFNQNHNKRKGNFNGNKNQKSHPQKKNITGDDFCHEGAKDAT
ncbi:hypothetical protein TIFTF001_048265 [Ficus carica]|uniref:Retrotransposon gag domain-containing protein n=1 Tax=Ficus carica TaxID=3494 RepID=A0AA87ZUJ1_FICCA|nr:hypothetical protein TIFTF001_048263 [Ficus carica]GMN33538.1 hypothetical protein TIFTF001_048265 [Ficus carica]